jgi:hypothetical protein
MKWDNESIAVCEGALPHAFLFYTEQCSPGTFYRSAVPEDIVNGNPNPLNWGRPTAVLTNQNCDIKKFFRNHVIVFSELHLFYHHNPPDPDSH